MAREWLKPMVLFTLEETSLIVTSSTAVSILHLRNPQSLHFGVGSLVALISAKIFKSFIRQSRPILEVTGSTTKNTYGMPSTHSSSISFFTTYLTLTCIFFHLHPQITRFIPIQFLTQLRSLDFSKPQAYEDLYRTFYIIDIIVRIAVALFMIIAGTAICWSRIYLGHHTQAQVLAGASLGSTIGIVWFALWKRYFIQYDLRLQRIGEDLLIFIWEILTTQGILKGSQTIYNEMKSWDWHRILYKDALDHREL